MLFIRLTKHSATEQYYLQQKRQKLYKIKLEAELQLLIDILNLSLSKSK